MSHMDSINTMMNYIIHEVDEVKLLLNNEKITITVLKDYYNKEFHKKIIIDNITFYVNKLFEELLTEIVQPLNCEFNFMEYTDFFGFKLISSTFGEIGTIETCDIDTFYCSSKNIASIISKTDMKQFHRLSTLLTELEQQFKEHNIEIKFT